MSVIRWRKSGEITLYQEQIRGEIAGWGAPVSEDEWSEMRIIDERKRRPWQKKPPPVTALEKDILFLPVLDSLPEIDWGDIPETLDWGDGVDPRTLAQ